MAFIPKNITTLHVGDTVVLTKDINTWYGTFEKGTIVKIISKQDNSYCIADENDNTASGLRDDDVKLIDNDTSSKSMNCRTSVSEIDMIDIITKLSDEQISQELKKIENELEEDTLMHPISGARSQALYDMKYKLSVELEMRMLLNKNTTGILDANNQLIRCNDTLISTDTNKPIIIDPFGAYIKGAFTYDDKHGNHELLGKLAINGRQIPNYEIAPNKVDID